MMQRERYPRAGEPVALMPITALGPEGLAAVNIPAGANDELRGFENLVNKANKRFMAQSSLIFDLCLVRNVTSWQSFPMNS